MTGTQQSLVPSEGVSVQPASCTRPSWLLKRRKACQSMLNARHVYNRVSRFYPRHTPLSLSLFFLICCWVSKLCSSVLHYLLEFAPIQVHWVRDAIRTSHPSHPSGVGINITLICQLRKVRQSTIWVYFVAKTWIWVPKEWVPFNLILLESKWGTLTFTGLAGYIEVWPRELG